MQHMKKTKLPAIQLSDEWSDGIVGQSGKWLEGAFNNYSTCGMEDGKNGRTFACNK